jgi:hypothetical protein
VAGWARKTEEKEGEDKRERSKRKRKKVTMPYSIPPKVQ